jgi:hypothetical protein
LPSCHVSRGRRHAFAGNPDADAEFWLVTQALDRLSEHVDLSRELVVLTLQTREQKFGVSLRPAGRVDFLKKSRLLGIESLSTGERKAGRCCCARSTRVVLPLARRAGSRELSPGAHEECAG